MSLQLASWSHREPRHLRQSSLRRRTICRSNLDYQRGVRIIGREEAVAALMLPRRSILGITRRYEPSPVIARSGPFRRSDGASSAGLRPVYRGVRYGRFKNREGAARRARRAGRSINTEILRKGDTSAADDHFRRSLDLAYRQGALSWELRTATSLARLRRDTGRMQRRWG